MKSSGSLASPGNRGLQPQLQQQQEPDTKHSSRLPHATSDPCARTEYKSLDMDNPLIQSSTNTTSNTSPSHCGTARSLLVEKMKEDDPDASHSNNSSESQTSYQSADLAMEEVRITVSAATATSTTTQRPRTLLSRSAAGSSSSNDKAKNEDGGNTINNNNVNRNDSNNAEDAGASSESPAPLPWHRKLWKKWQVLRLMSGKIVNNNHVQLFMVSLIAFNALMMGVATFHFVTDNPHVTYIFETMDTICLIIFTIELGMQFLYTGWRLFLDGWLVFDFVVIVMSWSFESVQIIRAFRIFRALRLITRIKIMKNLVLALFSVMPRMFAIGVLLMLVSYIFAVMCTQLFKDLYPLYSEEDYWGRLDATFFTLFQIMTLDNWADITRETMAAYPYAWCPIIIFVVITGFVVVNLIIAVICDAISALHEDDKARIHGNYAEGDQADGESIHPAIHADVRQQLTMLETHVEELTKMQAETIITLRMLAASISEGKVKRKQLASLTLKND